MDHGQLRWAKMYQSWEQFSFPTKLSRIFWVYIVLKWFALISLEQFDMLPTQKKDALPILYRHPYSKHVLYYANMATLGIPLSIEAHGMLLLTEKNRTLQPAATQCPNVRPSGPAVCTFRPVLFASAKLTLSTKRHCPWWWVLHKNAFAEEKTNNRQLSK